MKRVIFGKTSCNCIGLDFNLFDLIHQHFTIFEDRDYSIKSRYNRTTSMNNEYTISNFTIFIMVMVYLYLVPSDMIYSKL